MLVDCVVDDVFAGALGWGVAVVVVGEDAVSVAAVPFAGVVVPPAAGVAAFAFAVVTVPAFIHAYFPLLKPAACVATAFDSLF